MQHFRAVCADKVKPVCMGADPFAVGSVNGDAGYGHSVQQVICQSATVVTGNLNLFKAEIVVKITLGIFNDEYAEVGSAPNSTVQILCHAVEFIRGIGCAVLIDDGGAQNVAVVTLCVQCARGVKAEETTSFHATAVQEHQPAAMHQIIVAERNAVNLVVMERSPFAVCLENADDIVGFAA